MQLAPHGRLTRGGFLGSDGLRLAPVVNEGRLRERVGERGPISDRNGVAIALDHLKALPAALPLQREQIRAGPFIQFVAQVWRRRCAWNRRTLDFFLMRAKSLPNPSTVKNLPSSVGKSGSVSAASWRVRR